MGYVELGGPGPAYVRGDALGELGRVDVVVFDCDGVLLDVRRSYVRALAWTVALLVEAFTGARVPEGLVDPGLSHAYKRTGGFNNDWGLAYALTMAAVSQAPGRLVGEINRVAEEAACIVDPSERLRYIRGNRPDARLPLGGLRGRLTSFAASLDESGPEAVDSLLGARLGLVGRALALGGGVGESLVSTVFEEALLGRRLFRETFGREARFAEGELGFVEDEEVVVSEATLLELASLLGGPRLGVASGSVRSTALYALRGAERLIPEGAQVWHGDVDAAMAETGRRGLHKPDPYSLVRACEPFRPYARVLYVGDTAADRVMVERAGEGFLFAGVYGCTHAPEESMREFLDAGCAVVAPTVNEVPGVLRRARGG
jgi:phosphoglycolate phosphatase-like HAD superfamily hydrolase